MSAKGKVVVITGASSGIGATTSRFLAQQGAKLMLIARHQQGLDQIQAEFPKGQVLTATADVTDFNALQAALN